MFNEDKKSEIEIFSYLYDECFVCQLNNKHIFSAYKKDEILNIDNHYLIPNSEYLFFLGEYELINGIYAYKIYETIIRDITTFINVLDIGIFNYEKINYYEK